MSWEDVSFVVRSKTRKSVLMELQTPKTPTMLARELHTSLANISRTLRELQRKGLVECITPRVRVGKIFALTDKGKRVSAKIKSMEGE
jgi:predicted transcriptional regulator